MVRLLAIFDGYYMGICCQCGSSGGGGGGGGGAGVLCALSAEATLHYNETGGWRGGEFMTQTIAVTCKRRAETPIVSSQV